MFSQEFRNNWGHFFWVGLVALGLTMISGGPTILPWLALLELIEFTVHVNRHHPEHPLLEGNRLLFGVIGCLSMGIILFPVEFWWFAGMKLPGAFTAVRLWPLFSVQHHVSRWIHEFVHGTMQRECDKDPVLFALKSAGMMMVMLSFIGFSIVFPAVLRSL